MNNSQSLKGFVSLVGAGPGDPDLITLRGLRCLQQAEVVIYDRLANKALLEYAPQAQMMDVGKQPQHHKVSQEQINALLVEQALAGKRVVRLKGGDPFVFGRGGEEALALVAAGIRFEVVPGITSGIAAPTYAGIPVTHRGISTSVALITGHEADDDRAQGFSLRAESCTADTLVFYMGVKNLPHIVEQLLALGRSPETPVALIENGTLPDQKVVTGTLQNIVARAAAVRPPAVTIVGSTVDLRRALHWYGDPPSGE